MSGRYFIARHGETVFNAAARLHGETVHTPLTRAGFAQAEAIGAALRDELGPKPPLAMWASDSGRALQTLAVVAEHLDLDWHGARTDNRLGEIGMGRWSGRLYRDVIAEAGPVRDDANPLPGPRAPGGESFLALAERLRAWLGDHGDGPGDKLVITHSVTSRVLRGILTGLADRPDCGAPVADRMAQGSVAMIADGRETLLHRGSGHAPA